MQRPSERRRYMFSHKCEICTRFQRDMDGMRPRYGRYVNEISTSFKCLILLPAAEESFVDMSKCHEACRRTMSDMIYHAGHDSGG